MIDRSKEREKRTQKHSVNSCLQTVGIKKSFQ